jgi:hypothetical protein
MIQPEGPSMAESTITDPGAEEVAELRALVPAQ